MTDIDRPRAPDDAVDVTRAILAAVLAAALIAVTVPADALPSSCPDPSSTWNGQNPWCYAWEGDWRQTAVSVPSPDGPLRGTEFTPVRTTSRRPALAILHGLGGNEHNMWYLGRYLGAHGYVALTVSTAGNNANDFLDAMRAMADFLRSPGNPLARYIDTTRIGAAGHSAGARATSWIQDVDHTHARDHVEAVVALDNLTSNTAGDSGTYLLAPQCSTGIDTSSPDTPITPRVPALGLASDDNAVTCPERNVIPDPDAKKAAWSKWRAAGLPSFELVLRGANHLSFDQDASRTLTGEAYLQLVAELTGAWFDAYLGRSPAALRRLTGASLFGVPRDEQLSTQFRSAAYLPGRLDCADFTTKACRP